MLAERNGNVDDGEGNSDKGVDEDVVEIAMVPDQEL